MLYRGIRYHLKEQRLSSQKPTNYKELFNLRHASLRNVIERIFGILKRKYQILRRAPEYLFETQTRIIIACCALHNFVRSIEGEAADTLLATESQAPLEDLQPVVAYPSSMVSSKKMDKFRDDIVKRI